MPNIFWNVEQKRLRAFWRICVQTAITILLTAIFSIVLYAGIRIYGGVQLKGPTADLPQIAEAISDLIQSHPGFFLLSEILTFLPVLISIYIACHWLDKRKTSDLGLHFSRNWWIDFAFGLALGAVLMTFIFVIEFYSGWITIKGTLVSFHQPFGLSLALGLFAFLCVGISEELVSRGYQFLNLAEGFSLPRMKPRQAILLAYILSSGIFGLLHLGNPETSLVSTINLILAGLFLGIGMLLTGELAIGIGVHITWNFFQGMVFGFPVSGLEPGTTFVSVSQAGPQVWTGGAFGPEAGLVGLLAISLGSILTLLWIKYRYGSIRIFNHVEKTGEPAAEPD